MCKILQIVVCFLSPWSWDVARLRSGSPGLIPGACCDPSVRCWRFPCHGQPAEEVLSTGALQTPPAPNLGLSLQSTRTMFSCQELDLDMNPVGPIQLGMSCVFHVPVLQWFSSWLLREAWAEQSLASWSEKRAGWACRGLRRCPFPTELDFEVMPFSALQPVRAFACHAPISIEVYCCFCNSSFVDDILPSKKCIPVKVGFFLVAISIWGRILDSSRAFMPVITQLLSIAFLGIFVCLHHERNNSQLNQFSKCSSVIFLKRRNNRFIYVWNKVTVTQSCSRELAHCSQRC